MSEDEKAADPAMEVTLTFRCHLSDLKGTEVGDLYGYGRRAGITTGDIGRAVVNHRAEMGYVHWHIAPHEPLPTPTKKQVLS